MSNVNERVGLACPELPVERYAVELLNSVRSPVLSSRLELLADNLSRVIEHYETVTFLDNQLMFILDTLSAVVTLTISVLRYKAVDRKLAINNIVTILRFIAENYSMDEYPEFRSSVPRETSLPVEPDVPVNPKPKRSVKKV